MHILTKADIRPPVNIKLESLDDLVRMLVFGSPRDRPANLLHFERDGKHIYGNLVPNHGYYEYYGLPLWIYVESDIPPDGKFIAYHSRPEEKVDIVDKMESEPMVAYLSIIKLAEPLEILDF